MEKKTDRRSIKSQQAIRTAFLELLYEQGFDAITVKEITERADISRKTFYLHYVDKYALLDAIVMEQVAELAQLCAEKKEQGMAAGAVLWFQYFEQRKEFFAALFAIERTVSFRNRLMEFMLGEFHRRLQGAAEPETLEVTCKFMANAVLGVVESYVLNQFCADTEAVAQQVGILLDQLMMQFYPVSVQQEKEKINLSAG